MRLINADELIENFLNHCRTEFEIKNCCMANENVIAIIQNAPTVERPQGERTERALTIIDRLRTDEHINNKECGTLRRAILLPERRQGKWVRHIRSIECSVCKDKFFADDENENCQDYEPCIDFNFNYCPNCGADMRGGKEE